MKVAVLFVSFVQKPVETETVVLQDMLLSRTDLLLEMNFLTDVSCVVFVSKSEISQRSGIHHFFDFI